MLGWMVTVIVLARGPFLAGERYAWQAIAWPPALWCLVDPTFSLAHGAWGNVVLNKATALVFGIPLLGARRHFADPA